MKRLVFRIGALGTVVVLGLIAIAQAQRGAVDSATPDGESAAGPASQAALRTVSPPVKAGSASPTATVAGRPAEHPLRDSAGGGQAPAGTRADHPLRDSGGGRALEDVPPARIPTPDSTTSLPPNDSAPAERPADNQPAPPAGAIDPFVRHTGGNAPTGPSASPLGLDGQGSGSSPSDLSAAEPPSADRYADRHSELRSEAVEGGEPGYFRADPLDAPRSLGSSGAAAPPLLGGPSASAPDDPTLPPVEGSATAGGVLGGGTGLPGPRSLEGPQSPQLSIQKLAPKEVRVGKPATFRIRVRNAGAVAAEGVEVRDQVPKGARLLGTTPRATRGTRGELVWKLQTLPPGEEASVEMQVVPTDEGEMGSVATVHFAAQASARCVVTKPELVLKASGPEKVLIGENVVVRIEVSNPGSGVATGVVLAEHVPPGLQHPAGRDLEYEIGDLPPGDSRELELTLTATQPGPATNLLVARGDGNLSAEERLNLEVTAPLLDVALDGPTRRYLEREARYRLVVANPGTAAAEQIELVAYLPSGLEFVRANNHGHYEQATRAVHWRLEELPVNVSGAVELVTMPVEPGEHKIRLRGVAERVAAVEKEQPVVVEGIAAILFQAVDVTDPIEVGAETTYEIRVLNQGSKAATDVQLVVLLPPEMRPVAAEGPTRHAVEGNRVRFEGLSRLAPKADTTYRVRARGMQPGDLRTRVQLLTAEMSSPVTKEESTRVYADE